MNDGGGAFGGELGRVGASSSVSVTVPRAILAALRARGLDPAPLLETIGLDEALLGDARARIPAVHVARLWNEAPALAGDETFGLMLGATSAEALSLGAYMLRSCATFGEGLQRVWTYYRVFNDVHGLVVEQPDPATLTLALVTNGSPLPSPRHAIEFAFAWLVAMARTTTGRELAPVAVGFTHDPPASTEAHAQFFKCPVAFARPRSEISFPLEWLALPHVTFDPHLRELVELEAQAELARLPERTTVAGRVREVVRPMLASDAAALLDVVAERLRMSARTLQRYLKDEGTTFQRVLDQLRREVAEERLRDSDVSLAEIAHELGFADQSAFHKAFVRWTGKTPGECRRR